ncbi:MAG: adhesin [Pasteurellaceae bacterium]|nr:adhesin [Pasteurellaceae bacterium]
MSTNQQPSVLRFEYAVKQGDHEQACTELLAILGKLDHNFGEITDIECDIPEAFVSLPDECNIHFCTRMAVSITQLFSDPELVLSDNGTLRFLILQRWIALIFASSPYLNADHILQTYNQNPDRENPNEIFLDNSQNALKKFCVLYFLESQVIINLDAMWAIDPKMCISLCFALQSPRFIGTAAAFSKRHVILQWLPEKLAQLENLDDIPANITHDVYMHCSYDIAKNKHDVKKALNQVIRRYLLRSGWEDRDVSTIGQKNGKPVMIVMLEHFHNSHSIYRTHSTSIIAAKEKFHVVGLGHPNIDEAGKAIFDEYHDLGASTVMDRMFKAKVICDAVEPAVFYMPSIGMDLHTIFASNTRLAPIQAVALGHPATTHSEFIEYVIVEDDYVGSEACFSERLLRLPKDALPYVPSAFAPNNVEYRLRPEPEVVQIGIAATTMKLNPYFLEALKVIRDRAKIPVHFHFLIGQSIGISHPYISRFIKSYLGDSASAYPHTPYQEYLAILHQCDMVLNPFPFGNTNGIIDMVTLGLAGVCKTGDEVHEHIDEGLFKRLGLPEWLITNNVDEYVDCAIRLIENHQERLAIRQHIIENNGLSTLFSGRPELMSEALMQKVEEWQLTTQAATSAKQPKTTKTRKTATTSKAKTGKKPALNASTKPTKSTKPKVANKTKVNATSK